MRNNILIKKIASVVIISTLMLTGVTACGSKKKSAGATASGGEIKDEAKVEKESTEESKIYLENTSDEVIILKDEDGKEIKISEGETLPIKEKTIDKKTGEELYVLSNGSTIKASSVSEAAKEVVTTVKSETVKNVVKNDNPTQAQVKPQLETPAPTQAQEQPKPQPETPVPTQVQEQPKPQPETPAPTQAQEQPKPQPETPAPTQAQPKPTEPQPQPTTEAPTKASYTGYREDLDQRAAQMIIELRNNDSRAIKNPTWNEHLYKVAQVRAKELATDFSHNSASNARSGYNISEACTMFYASSEFYKFDEAYAAIGSWRYSPEHYDIIMTGNQYAVSCYQQGDTVYWVCLTGGLEDYIAENIAAIQAAEWGQPGSPKYEEKYQKYYNSFVSLCGERKIW